MMLSVTNLHLVLSSTNDAMSCIRALPLCESSGLPPGYAIDIEVSARLFDRILCDRGRWPLRMATVAEVTFAIDEDVALLEAIETVAQVRQLAIRDGQLRITWPCLVRSLRPSSPRPERATATNTAARTLGGAIDLVRGYAGRGTGNTGHERVMVAAGATFAGTGRALCIARLPGIGAVQLDLGAGDAAVLARIIRVG